MGLIRGVLTQIGWTILRQLDQSKTAVKDERKNLPGTNFLRLVPQPNFLGKSLMERKRTGFTTTVIRHLTQSQKAACTRNGDDMSVIAFQHRRQELAHSPIVRYRVYFKHGSDHALGLIEDGAFFADTGVVDEHRWIAVVSANESANLFDVG